MTNAFETGVFVESPSSGHHPALTGFLASARSSGWPNGPFPVSRRVSLEYAFLKQPGT
jgi:hypothetical protein